MAHVAFQGALERESSSDSTELRIPLRLVNSGSDRYRCEPLVVFVKLAQVVHEDILTRRLFASHRFTMNGHQGYTRLEGSSEVEAFSSRPQMPSKDVDGGALFVLESKGNWKHAGFHLTVSIATPALLTLPFALRELGWVAGVLALGLCAGVSFYAYNILSQVLENSERRGHRFLRFRDLGAHVLGPWGYYGIGGIQFLVCFGTVIGSCIVGGQSMKLIYSILEPESTRQLSEFVAIFGIFMQFC